MAPKILYHAPALPARLNAAPSRSVSVSPGQLAWAAATVGRPDLDAVLDGPDADLEMSWRAGITLTSLTLSEDASTWVMHDRLRALDGSEKAVATYLLGGVSAKIFAEQLAGIPWLVHYDRYLRSIPVALTGRRPDFIGRRPPAEGSTTVLIEAKSRSSRVPPRVMDEALDKTRQERDRRHPGALAWAHGAYWTEGGEWRATMRMDEPVHAPSAASESDEDSSLIHDRLEAAYYRPIAAAIRARRAKMPHNDSDPALTTARFAEIDLAISMPTPLYRTYSNAQYSDRPHEYESAGSQLPVTDPVLSFSAGDGITASLGASWHERFEAAAQHNDDSSQGENDGDMVVGDDSVDLNETQWR